jgi:protein-tyrosine-phosphatase
MKVLFVCEENRNRSQIAAAIFNKMSKRDHAVSAGMATKPGSDGTMLRKALNNPVLPMKIEGYDLSRARIKRLNRAMLKSADKVILIRSKKALHGVMPSILRGLPDVEWWDVNIISEGTPFDEYCRLEKKRIKKIRALVKGLVKQIE